MALQEVLAEMPFPVRHIQVDGGSEFMGEFELACMKAGIPLIVLLPRSPKLNGHVERANGTDRHEFFGFYEVGTTIAEVRRAAKKWQYIYNHIRPHKSLNLIPPARYLANLNRKTAA
ncbi:MAG: transposase [Bacteroidetes bacterium]|nr:MAG: transposase [Bacteroidota bacterium]